MNKTFPRWSAPLVGALVGAVATALVAPKTGVNLDLQLILGGALVGLLAGVLILLFGSSTAGPPPSTSSSAGGLNELQAQSTRELPLEGYQPDGPRMVSGWQRYSIALALGTMILPPVGPVFAVAALVFNWRPGGWRKIASLISLALSVVWTIVALHLLEFF